MVKMMDKPTLESITCDMKEEVGFEERCVPTADILPVPRTTDDVEVVRRKIKALASIMEEGRSLAIRTDFQLTTHDPEKTAIASMTDSEYIRYNMWKSGKGLGDYNWQKCIWSGVADLDEIDYCAAADTMAVIFQDNSITADNAAWFITERAHLNPLLSAVAKVEAAKRDIHRGQTKLSETELDLAEIQTARRIVATSMSVLRDTMRWVQDVNRDITTCCEIIEGRVRAIKQKGEGSTQ